jgi:hypothetical protein
MRITAACPAPMMPDANQLAMALGESTADAETYRNPSWQDADGNLYAAASFEARDEWIAAAQQPLQRPAWDTHPYQINMTGAKRAQAALVFSLEPVLVTVTTLTAIGGVDGLEALKAMGLTQVQEGE